MIKVLNRLRVLKYLNVNGGISLNGKHFKIPILEKVGFSNLVMSEPWMIDLLKIVMPIEEKVFVDVGVNIGQTLLKLRCVSDSSDYIGFEPNPLCINYVNRLIKENGIKNSVLVPVGISDKSELGELTFFYESGTDSSASMIENFRPGQKMDRKEYIPLLDLGEIKKTINLDQLSVLKIDVEGAELEVLRSFYNEIKENNPIILIEILPAYDEQNKNRINRQNEIQKLLKELGYTIFTVIKQNEILLDLKEISEMGIHSDLNACEYVMVPDSKKEEFLSQVNKR
ncbi:MAG: FkbM family methyltransferase [Flavobacteriales bacterium]|nr:FkbM family methyltransferase [Flavobacteriales bacterium]